MSEETFIAPDFGSDEPTGRKLAIICSKGNLDMAYPGLILGNAALGEGVQVDLHALAQGCVGEHQPGVGHVEGALGADDGELSIGLTAVEIRHRRRRVSSLVGHSDTSCCC